VIRILHLFDDNSGWQERVGASQLIDRLPVERFTSRAAAMSGRVRRWVLPGGQCVDLWSQCWGIDFLGAPAARRYLQDQRVDLIHAWGIRAALAAAAVGADTTPIVIELFDPGLSDRQAKMLRSIAGAGRFAIVCSTQTVRRCLVEKGLEADRCVVIRPGVDFALINAARRSDLRGRLGLSRTDRVLIAPEPATRRGGHFTAFWTTGVRSFLEPHVRLIIPGQSPEQARVARLAGQVGLSHLLCCPGEGVPCEELIAIADAMLVPSSGEVPTTGIAWAMAAGVPVLATAVYATAEMLADRHNGLLVKPDSFKRVALRLVTRLDDRRQLAAVSETARGQAYQIFGLRRCVDQHARLYENLLAARLPADGITDSAVDV